MGPQFDGVKIDCKTEHGVTAAVCLSLDDNPSMRKVDDETYYFSLFGGVSWIFMLCNGNGIILKFVHSRVMPLMGVNSKFYAVRRTTVPPERSLNLRVMQVSDDAYQLALNFIVKVTDVMFISRLLCTFKSWIIMMKTNVMLSSARIQLFFQLICHLMKVVSTLCTDFSTRSLQFSSITFFQLFMHLNQRFVDHLVCISHIKQEIKAYQCMSLKWIWVMNQMRNRAFAATKIRVRDQKEQSIYIAVWVSQWLGVCRISIWQ